MERSIGVIMNGVTGRMGTNQHLVRSILAIKEQGGVKAANGDKIIPEPILVGRNESKLANLASLHGIKRYTTDLDEALSDKKAPIYFDSTSTELRIIGVGRAIEAGKAIYCEKPIATNLKDAVALANKARAAGVKNGVVQDKLWLPGLLKLRNLIDTGFFGQILSVRGEFGYWVFDGFNQPTQRPSWNYRKEDGGGIIIDMFCHWRYIIDNLFGDIKRLSTLGSVHIPERADEAGKRYKCTADDAAYATFELKNGIICQFNSSWSVRVRRDDLLTLQADGTEGSAVAGLTQCYVQPDGATPKAIWNPDIESPIDYFKDWTKIPPGDITENAFKAQWELFIKHVIDNTPFRWDLMEGAKGVQLAELGLKSWQERRWVDVQPIAEGR
jgi:predicted dehydrogenase